MTSVKFFGQYLLLEGAVSMDQLREALQLMENEHRVLGQLAVDEKLLTADQANEINQEQMNRDLPFGKLAIEQGLLNEEQVQALIKKQNESRIRIGEAFIRLGHLDEASVEKYLAKFQSEQGSADSLKLTLPGDLSDNNAAHYLLEFLPKIAMRVARMHLKVANGPKLLAEGDSFSAGIALAGQGGIEIGLHADTEFSKRIMVGMLRLMSGEFDRTVADIEGGDEEDLIGEFLSIVAGHSLGALASEGYRLRVSAPFHGRLPQGGTPFQLLTPQGSACLLIKSS